MGTHRYSISIDAPPEAAYDLFSDPERHAEWESGNPRVTNLSGSTRQPGTTYDLTYGGGSQAGSARSGRLTYHARVEAADRPHRFAIFADGPLGLRASTRSEFVPENGGTRATLEMELRWPIPLLGRLLEFVILPPRVVRQELARFKAIAERESQPKPQRR
jgi:uncharacterized protein YndB with AHSA1/START domain